MPELNPKARLDRQLFARDAPSEVRSCIEMLRRTEEELRSAMAQARQAADAVRTSLHSGLDVSHGNNSRSAWACESTPRGLR